MPPEVLAAMARHRAEVSVLLDQISDDVLAAWVRAWSDIEAELLREWPESRILQRRRLEQAKRMAGARIIEAVEATGVTLSARARAMVERGLWEQPELIAAQLPAEAQVSILRPPGAEVDAMVARVQQQVTARTVALSAEATAAMRRSLVLGVAKGENPRDTARRMVTQARGAFEGGLHRAQVIARTEMITAHRDAAELAHRTSADVLKGWVWWAQLGPRTCPSCIAQHGQLHDLDTPGPLDHQQGRCARVPVTKTWEELGFAGVPEPPRPPVESGPDWLARQPESVQRSVLGPKRFEAWKAGDYPPEMWSIRKESADWRPSYHVGPVPD